MNDRRESNQSFQIKTKESYHSREHEAKKTKKEEPAKITEMET